jgi:hypothetical protein
MAANTLVTVDNYPSQKYVLLDSNANGTVRINGLASHEEAIILIFKAGDGYYGCTADDIVYVGAPIDDDGGDDLEFVGVGILESLVE